jgi:hypothetical protein
MRQTVLVTGIHRSGSTWVGQVLNHLPHTYYIPELFNPDNVSGFLREPFERNYEYVCADNEQDYIQRITDALDFRYPLGSNWHKAASAGEKTQVLKRYAANAVRRQMSRPNIILKDPTAFFSSEWLHQRFNAKVVLLIRHPAAFTSSVKRLGWRISCKPLLDQRLLVRDYLGPFEEEIRNEPKDYVGRCALFWKVVYSVAHQFQKKWPGIEADAGFHQQDHVFEESQPGRRAGRAQPQPPQQGGRSELAEVAYRRRHQEDPGRSWRRLLPVLHG